MDVAKIAGLEIEFLDGRIAEYPEDVLIERSQRVVGHVQVSQPREVVDVVVHDPILTIVGPVDPVGFEREHLERLEPDEHGRLEGTDQIVLHGEFGQALGARKSSVHDAGDGVKVQFHDEDFGAVEIGALDALDVGLVHLEGDELLG